MKLGVHCLTVMLLAGAAGVTTNAQPAAQGQQGQQGQQRPGPIPSLEERTNGMRKIDGYFPLYWDERTGSLFLEISRLDTDFLFSSGFSAGFVPDNIRPQRRSRP